MANEMIKFYKGLEASLPASGVNGALYITTDEGAIYLGTGTGMKRLGDFVQVANVDALPAKAHESCLYYCVAENILAKWNGTEWKQINKQPTADELKVLLGLGSLAYKSIVAEGDLDSELKAKVNAAAEGNHSHSNKTLLDTYTQTEADLADAVAKKHEHANKTELDLIVSGDKAKWDAVAADHLTSADKTTLENAIKEAKKAGTDANTALEGYKVTNDAAIDAIEEDIAEITDGTNGILAQAKSYSDGKLDAAKTAISAEIDADVKVVADELAGYKTSNDAALAGVKATAEAAAVKTEVESALNGKVAKTDYEADKATFATKTELGNVDAKFGSYTTTTAQQAIDAEQNRRLGVLESDHVGADDIKDFETKENVKKVADDLAAYVELNDAVIADRYTKTEADGKFVAKEDAYDDEEVRGLIGDNAQAIEDLETYVGTIPSNYTEETVIAYINKKAEETLAAAQGGSSETAASVKQQLDNYKSENDTRVGELEDALDAEIERATGVEADLQEQITANANAINVITNGVDAEKIDSLNDLIEWADEHAPEVKSIKEDIEANAKAISDHEALAAETYETKTDATSKKTEIDGRLSALEGKVDVEKVSTAIAVETTRATGAEEALAGRIKDLEDNKAGYATTGEVATAKSGAEAKAAELDAALKAELQGEIDADVQALAATVYAKSETFTKEEVNAAIATAIETAHTWGSF